MLFIFFLVLFFFFTINYGLSIFFNTTAHCGLELSYCLDIISNTCLIMLLVCGIISIYFSLHYYSWLSNYLNYLIVFFLLIMCYLVCTNNMINTLISWEYLGFVSFLLILYYSNYDTSRAANITLVSSRFGDVGLFILLGLSYFFYPFNYIFIISALLVLITKSAILPFSSWLLEAMRAPTPVSCLVHSSTLVAAGIWFLMRYSYGFSITTINILFFCALITIILSSISALILLDTKKLVALSTCNNISWCVVYFCLGSTDLCLIQLLSHGIAKCMLFCSVGDLLQSSGGNQINSGLYSSVNQNIVSSFLPGVLVFFISGLPYLGVFFTKHLLLGGIGLNSNLVLWIIVFFCVFLTYVYSFRLFLIICNLNYGQNSGIQSTYNFMSTILLLSCVTNFLLVGNLEEISYLTFINSLIILVVQGLGLYIGSFFYSNMNYNLVNGFLGQDFLILINNMIFNVLSIFFLILGSFRFERYLQKLNNNTNIFNVNFANILQIMVFFCFFFVSLFCCNLL
uniref:NADH:ubiquinone reductase (H(+)-translocating) n=1 Tax=Megalobenedenia derzhavini TaxID=3068300 RepID=A0AA49QLW3_9PLAT|nr:NADH dehydrogenase subunit 5 [Megalobenedenia derzhavini]WLG31377.1 NADH dehydrogenase subunit 5 [Megalobenedenia derzhavini]